MPDFRAFEGPELTDESPPGPTAPAALDWFRIADGFLGLDCDHTPVTHRWREIYHDCRCAGPEDGFPSLSCSVRASATPHLVRLDCDDDEPLDPIEFNLRIVPDPRYVEMASPLTGWRFLARSEAPDVPFAGFRGRTVFINRADPWEAYVAHYTLHRILRLQRNIMVFHSSAVSVHGSGVMMLGPRKAGKTTLSLALAAMGHRFFGDEFAAVRRDSSVLVPFQRAVSIRSGPAAAPVEAAINSGRYSSEVYPDGAPRYRIPASDVTGGQPATPVPVGALFFLQGFADRPSVTPFQAGLQHLRLLSPLGSTVAGAAPGQTVADFLRLLKRARCYFIHPGGAPQDTAELIVRTMETA